MDVILLLPSNLNLTNKTVWHWSTTNIPLKGKEGVVLGLSTRQTQVCDIG
jgi:hypothetical protein